MMLYYGGLDAEMAYRLERLQAAGRRQPRTPRRAWLRNRRRPR